MLLFTSFARREGGFFAPLVLAGEPVLTAVEDEPYDGFTLTASGGVPPYTYGVHSGILPTGITLDAGTGEVSGTPTEVGTFLDIVLKVTDDANNEAFLDPFTLEVSAPPSSIAIVNGGFEAGDLSGWTNVDGGNWSAATAGTTGNSDPRTGTFYGRCLGPGTTGRRLRQELVLLENGFTPEAIDAGTLTLSFHGYVVGEDGVNDGGWLRATFLDAADGQISVETTPTTITPAGVYQLVTLDVAVPIGTRKVRLDVAARTNAGGSTHAAWDDIEASIS